MSLRCSRASSLRLLSFAIAALVAGAVFGSALAASAATFNPELIISNDNMRAADSMSVKQIQAFLETQGGPLATLVTSDYDRVITLSKTKDNVNTTPDKGEAPKPASRIIWEACQQWNISPKVMLTMLQKEQSLLTTVPKSSKTLARAVGAGCPGRLVFPSTNPVATNRYPGFGNQVWHGARLLDSYGQSATVVPKYYPGIVRKDIYRKPNVTLHMRNIATYKLYCYNPSIGASAPYGDLSSQAGRCTGNANFWLIYRRYFGSTFADPRMRPVYRFRKYSNGTYLYTSSIAEKYKLRTASFRRAWAYDGLVFSEDTSVTPTSTVPVYRFKNKGTGKFSFVTSRATYNQRRTTTGRRTWDYQGVAYRISRTKTTGAVALTRLRNRRTGAYLLTASKTTLQRYRTDAAYRRKWEHLGIAYYLPRYQAPPAPSTPATPTP